jgi:ribonucleoside-diphosphate reductase alpha chain
MSLSQSAIHSASPSPGEVLLPGAKIVKRNGDLVAFDLARIRRAIAAAVAATGEPMTEEALDNVTERVREEIGRRFVELYPNVENVQDIVEKHLMLDGRYVTAKAYILYRAERQRAREVARTETLDRARLGRLTTTKRDGRPALLNVRKIEAAFERAAAGLSVGTGDLVRETLRGLYEGVPTAQIDRAMILAATAYVESDPAYSQVAARLLLASLCKEVFGSSVRQDTYDETYRQAFRAGIEAGLAAGLFDQRMARFDLTRLAAALRPERDGEFEYLGVQTLADRYLARLGERRIETPQGFWMRVAMGLALAEEQPDERAMAFYDRMSRLLYVPSTPTLFHAGTKHPQLSSCYLTTVDDDLGHIFKCLADNAQLSKWSGGLGNDWTNVRATGAAIRSTRVESQGVVPFLKVANDATLAINRSGKRRGAACAYLETWHFDIEDFLDLRRNTGDDRRRTHDLNTANWIPDLFLKRVEAGGDWTLFSPDEVADLHHLYGRAFEERYQAYEAAAERGEMRIWKRLPAAQLWRKMLTVLFETGHPWLTFKDACNVRSPQDHAGVVHSSNLCTEITLNTSADETAVCNLGSINLGRHVHGGRVDQELLAETVAVAVRMLDNVIDLNFYPTPEARASNLRHRPVGLGVMGFQDALFQLRLPFGGERSVELADQLMEQIAFHTFDASCRLAAERGAYASFPGSKWHRGVLPQDTLDLLESERGLPVEVDRRSRLDWQPLRARIRSTGLRNSNCLAIAPTATIANIAGCFPSIEPIYKNLYVKANISGEFTIVNGYLVRDLRARGLWNQGMIEKLKFHDGNVGRIEEVPDDLRELYREAFAIEPLRLVELAAARGKWIDQSQSLNLFVSGASGRQLSDLYLAAWRQGLKTTYYLRTLAASQVEKSTLDAARFGFTQKRDDAPAVACKIDDPDCEACQ